MRFPNVSLRSSSRFRGFTLVEVVLVLAFAALLTTLVLIGYRRIETSGALQSAAQGVIQDIRRAQAFAVNTNWRSTDAPPVCGYGLHWTDPGVDDGRYVIYAREILSGVDATAVDCAAEPKRYGGMTLSTSSTLVRSAALLAQAGRVRLRPDFLPEDFSLADIYFLPPDPAIHLVQSSDGRPVPTPTSACRDSGAVCVKITLELTADPAQTRTILLYDSGRIELHRGG